MITVKNIERSLGTLTFVVLMILSLGDVASRLGSEETPFVLSRQECLEPNSDLDAFR